MALPQVGAVQLAFGGGIDESTRPELLEPGASWKTLENIRQDKRGGATKRPGFQRQALSRVDGSNRTAGYRIFTHDKQLCLIDDDHSIDAYAVGLAAWSSRGRVPGCAVRTQPIPSPSSAAYVYDLAYASPGVIAVASGTAITQTNKITLIDSASGAVLYGPTTIGSGNGVVYLASYSRYFFAFVYTTSSTAIDVYLFDTSTFATGWTSLASVTATSASLGFSVASMSDRVAIAYGITSGSNRVVVKTYNASGIVATSSGLGSGTTPGLMSIDGTTTLWVAYGEGSDVHAVALNPSTLAVTGTDANALTLTTGIQGVHVCEGNTSTTARLLGFSTDNTVQFEMCPLTISAGAVNGGTPITVYNAAPSSRPFRYGDRYYITVAPAAEDTTTGDNSQALCTLVDWTEEVTYLRPVAHVAPGLVQQESVFCKIVPVATGRYFYGLQVLKSGAADFFALISGSAAVGNTLVEFDFTSTQMWTTATHGGVTFLGGGILSAYDGERATEVGFVCAPKQPTGVDAGSGAGPNGSYRAVATYEDVDAFGNWHISGVSEPSASVTVADNAITWTTTSLTVSARIAKGTTRVGWWRTAAGGEPPYYRLGVSTNSTAAATVTFSDSLADASLTANSKLYAPSLPGVNGGAQDRRAPPGLLFPTSYNGMLVGAEGENLWFSGQTVYGEGTWFSPVFQLPVSGDGDITGLAAQDGTLYIFKRRAVYAVTGEAPSDNGAIGGLGVPRRLAVDVGCIDARSIVVTSLGIFFQSERGIELLTRAQSVTWVGEKVKETLASYPIVTSAVVDPTASVVYFECAESQSAGVVTGNGRALVFDLSLQVWISTDRRTGNALAADTDAPAQSSCMAWDGTRYRYTWLEDDGYTLQETDEYMDDVVAWITMRAETPMARPAGIQSNHSLMSAVLLAERHTNHQTRINVAYDDSTSWTDSETWTATETAALTREQLEIGCSKRQVNSVRVRIEDLVPSNTTATPVTTGKGATWVGLALNIGANNTRQATPNLPSGHRK